MITTYNQRHTGTAIVSDGVALPAVTCSVGYFLELGAATYFG